MSRKALPNPKELAQKLAQGDRVALGRAITFVESKSQKHKTLARELLAALPKKEKSTIRIGISGAPGAGKSTFIEALGLYLIEKGHKVAVLAVDPSSSISHGSILGDKTRMEELSTKLEAFIRPSAAGSSLGGVARKTRETIALVEAAGYDIVLIETVGVGQSEIAVQRMTDLFVLLLLPGAGDELQGIKRGIVEMADIILVNKADGDRKMLAKQAAAYYRNATHLLPLKASNWPVEVLKMSALQSEGIEEYWSKVQLFQEKTSENGHFLSNRAHQAKYWLEEALEQGLKEKFENDAAVQALRAELEAEVLAGKRSPFEVAEVLLDLFLGKGK